MELTDPRFWLFAGVVAIAFAAEATTGFGATVIALALGIHLFPLGELLPVFVPLGLFVSSWLVVRGRAHVNRPLLLARILPWMGFGLAVGLIIFERASHELLRRAFGVFVVLSADATVKHLVIQDAYFWIALRAIAGFAHLAGGFVVTESWTQRQIDRRDPGKRKICCAPMRSWST